MIAKKFLIALLVCFACFFMACDDSISASEDAVEESSKSVDSIYELGKCTDKLEGETRLVTKENAYYLCTEKEWVRTVAVKSSSSSVDSSSSEEKSSSSSGKKQTNSSSSTSKSSSSKEASSSSSKEKSSSSKTSSSSSAKEEKSSSSEKVSSSSSSQKVSSSSESDSESSSSAKSSSSEEKSSSSIVLGPSVTFVDSLIWIPEYGPRARTFFNTTGEANFLDESTRKADSSGWIFGLDDYDDDGNSIVEVDISSYIDVHIKLAYDNWSTDVNVLTGDSYFAPHPYPYGSVRFKLAPQGEADISDWKGICIKYSARNRFEFSFASALDYRLDGASYGKTLGATTSTVAGMDTTSRIVNIDFEPGASLDYPDWVVTKIATGELEGYLPKMDEFKKRALAFQFRFSNDQANVTCSKSIYSCTREYHAYFRIHKIGMYGTCDD